MQLNLDSKRLDFAFAFCLALSLATPALFAQLRLTFFAPFLVIVCYQKPLPACLWFAFVCGIILDLFSSYTRFGMHALDFCLTLLILYPQRRNFFADSLTTLPVMTFLFASLSSLIMAILLYAIEMKNIFSLLWIVADVILLSIADAAYAFFCFILPPLVAGKPRRTGKDYFLTTYE